MTKVNPLCGDAIAGLRKWNDDWPHWQFTEHQHNALRLVLDHSEGAATAIDAQQARVKELEAQLAVADATLLRLNSGKELQDLMRLNNELESRSLRAEQERDEAYERAAKVAFARAARWKDAMEHEDSPCGMSLYDECLDIGAIIRRLSAGPEKEGE